MNFLPNALRISVFIQTPDFAAGDLNELLKMGVKTMFWDPIISKDTDSLVAALAEHKDLNLIVKHNILLAYKLKAKGVLLGPSPSLRELMRAREVMGTQKWIGALVDESFVPTEEIDAYTDFYAGGAPSAKETTPVNASKRLLLVSDPTVTKDTEALKLDAVSGVCYFLKNRQSLMFLLEHIENLRARLGLLVRGESLSATPLNTSFQFSKMSSSSLLNSVTPLQTQFVK